jgi:plastocyanin
MTTRVRRFLVTMAAACAAAMTLSAGGSAEGPTIESAGPSGYGFYWSPSSATIAPGGSVAFRSTGTVVPHGIRWTGGSEKPSCAGVPVDGEGTGWSGSCSFAQAGVYSFVCTVHPTEMKGTIAVVSGETPAPVPIPAEGSRESPLRGPASRALRVARSQRGGSVAGSIALTEAAAGGRLEVVLLSRRGRSAAGARLGRFERSRIEAGRVAFTVALGRRGRLELRARKKLRLTVRVVLKAPGETALKLTRGVVLHG